MIIQISLLILLIPISSTMVIPKRFSVAPMMAHTNRHFRFFWRLLSKKSTLFSEMVVAEALLRSNSISWVEKIIGFDAAEQPIILQLGGREPTTLASAAYLGINRGYCGINLNCGCPSGTVAVDGDMGASMMLDPDHTAYCCAKISERIGSNAKLSVKCRVGVDDKDSYENLCYFIETIYRVSGVKLFHIHARKAILGIGALANREVPQLQYEWVYRLVRDFPDLEFEINGGIKSPVEVISHFSKEPLLAGAMVGRACINHPYSFVTIDDDIDSFMSASSQTFLATSGDTNDIIFRRNRVQQSDNYPTRDDVIMKYIDYCEGYGKLSSPSSVSQILAPTFNLFAGEVGCDRFRRRAKTMIKRGVKTPAFILRTALQDVPVSVRNSRRFKDIDSINLEYPWMGKVPKTSAPLRSHIS